MSIGWLTGSRVGINVSFSGWQDIADGVPQVPQLFTTCIIDLDERMNGMVAKFADGTKMGRKACCEQDMGL